MTICVLTFRVDSLTYTVVKALSFGGYDVVLHVVSPESASQWGNKFFTLMGSTPRVTISTIIGKSTPVTSDHLIVQGSPQLLDHRPVLDSLAGQARKVTVITSGDRLRPFREAITRQWREIRWYGRWLRRVKRIAYKDGYYARDLFSLFLPRYVVGFDAHSKFLSDKEVFKKIHTYDWEVDAQRPILANFLGSEDPNRRKRVLDSVRLYFGSSNDRTEKIPAGKTMFWHEFSDAQPAALDVTEYLGVLTRSDFTLCPPGYSLVTHRPIEAMLRGSIPVLNASELDLYDIGFIDGVNCIAVLPEEWASAMERILSISTDSVIEMRKNVYAMQEEQVDYNALSRHIRTRLGVENPAE